jgi:type III restriction enzyme
VPRLRLLPWRRKERASAIVDPHGFHLGDALSKLRGLADYSEQYCDEFHRIESVAEIKGGTPRVLDLKIPATRAAIRDAEALYLSSVANDYL